MTSAPKRPTIFPNSWGGLDNGDFLFLNASQKLKKNYNFLPKVATGVLFDYYDIVSKEEKQKIRRSISQ